MLVAFRIPDVEGVVSGLVYKTEVKDGKHQIWL